jgi:hypothetical protein
VPQELYVSAHKVTLIWVQLQARCTDPFQHPAQGLEGGVKGAAMPQDIVQVYQALLAGDSSMRGSGYESFLVTPFTGL